jgi:hypothetical protein
MFKIINLMMVKKDLYIKYLKELGGDNQYQLFK